jgi:NADH:ubiquinone oxidoreductase subunit
MGSTDLHERETQSKLGHQYSKESEIEKEDSGRRCEIFQALPEIWAAIA